MQTHTHYVGSHNNHYNNTMPHNAYHNGFSLNNGAHAYHASRMCQSAQLVLSSHNIYLLLDLTTC